MSSIGAALSALQVAFAHHPGLWEGTAAFTGACMASFGGVVVDRLPHSAGWRPEPREDVSLMTPSRCESCSRRLDPLSLVPVIGWIARGGGCPACKVRVPWRYPAAEAATALCSAALAAHFGPSPAALWALAALWACLVLAWIDWREAWLPDRITLTMAVAGLLGSPFEHDVMARNVGMAACAAAFALSFQALSWLKGERLTAGGDIALAAAAGAWIGIRLSPVFLMLSSVFYVCSWAAVKATGRRWEPADPGIRELLGERPFVPMGPALCLAFMACLLAA